MPLEARPARGDCRAVRMLLHGVAYGEADPQDAITVARHVSQCTGCRILLARERRLAVMLDDGFEDHLRVGEEFLQAVMAHLPQGPPPARPWSGRRRLKLARSGAGGE
jgi:predicted anti-sigma-YlaC factor YlaD